LGSSFWRSFAESLQRRREAGPPSLAGSRLADCGEPGTEAIVMALAGSPILMHHLRSLWWTRFLGRVWERRMIAKQSLSLQWNGFRVEARDDGEAWKGELYDGDDVRPSHVFELDLHRSLDNLVGLYAVPERLELAKLIAIEAAKLRV